jgi:UDP-N-acetylglucosamine--N-acetylmuramyl-(pentapeptide) pyrophosphoryl-undecaprenol N-acetylglucosamine transferase
MSRRRLLVMAGGTGGHVFPALAVAEWLREAGHEIVWLGTRNGIEARVVVEAGFPIEWITITGLRGNGWRRWIFAPLTISRALFESIGVIRRIAPCAVLGMGGFVTGPGGLAARLLGVPLLLHEQNAVAGLTNRLLSRLVSGRERLLEAYAGAFGRPATVTGNPLRRELSTAAGAPLPGQARPRLLVIGGSLGALILNETVPLALARLPAEQRPQVLHQAGQRHQQQAVDNYRAAGVDAEVVTFIADMADAYRHADLVVCRAGALTLAELAIVGRPAILIPYPYAVDDHQRRNAEALVAAGAAEMVIQSQLDAPRLAMLIGRLLGDRKQLAAMATAATGAARADATEQVASACLAACGMEVAA